MKRTDSKCDRPPAGRGLANRLVDDSSNGRYSTFVVPDSSNGRYSTFVAPTDCIFCHAEDRVLIANSLAFATLDGMPVSPGHTLIVPHRHCTSFFELSPDEVGACFHLLCLVRARLDQRPNPPAGYNVGVNVGIAAGQGVPHVHVHLIPRYRGDVSEPRGGVRNILPCRRPEHARDG